MSWALLRSPSYLKVVKPVVSCRLSGCLCRKPNTIGTNEFECVACLVSDDSEGVLNPDIVPVSMTGAVLDRAAAFIAVSNGPEVGQTNRLNLRTTIAPERTCRSIKTRRLRVPWNHSVAYCLCLFSADCTTTNTSGFSFRKGQALFRVTRSAMRKKKRQRDRALVVPGDGDPCPRCGVPMQIREYSNLTDKHSHRPYFYMRWFCCMNKNCRTTLVMPERYKVMNPVMLTDE
jgi:hypothetical protein